MSALPFLVKNARFGTTLGKNYQLEDYIQNQLMDSYIGLTLEKMADDLSLKYGLSRKDVDEYAMQSHLKWTTGYKTNAFEDEITKMTLTVKKKQIAVNKDDLPQPHISMETLAAMSSIVDGSLIITTGNSAVPADGAAVVLIAEEGTIIRHHLTPLARVAAWACVGCNPLQNKLGAVLAVRKLLDITGLNINQVDLFEINETFASQALVSINELKIDKEKVNVNGGAISIGNPVGATGARMAVHLVHQLRRLKYQRGIVASNCGGGQGLAVLFEAV